MFGAKEIVIACYRVLLGRMPESDSVVESKASIKRGVDQILQEFVASAEFRSRFALSLSNKLYRSKARRIEVECSEEIQKKLFDRVNRQWHKLGDSEPYWSVITAEEFKKNNINKTKKHFYGTGLHTAELIDEFHERAQLERPTGTCLELGCGVARVTWALATKFDRVIGVDISKGNLSVANDFLMHQGIRNVKLINIQDTEEFRKLDEFDFLFSTIVFQHNPPPVQLKILDTLLKKIKPSGAALIQIPTEAPDYSFSVNDYLSSPEPVLEMHCLPMKFVIESFANNGFKLLEVRPDNFTGMYGSYTFFAKKTKT